MNTGDRTSAYILQGTIYTSNDKQPVVEAMVVENGYLVALGNLKKIRTNYPSLEVIDHQDQFIYPGFIDPHCHFLGYGRSLQQADLRGATSIQDVIERLTLHYRDFPSEWLLGRGWDQNLWPNKAYPTKHDLNEAFADIPVYLVRIDGHAAWVNQKALDLIGIQDDHSFDEQLLLKENGRLTGILIDDAMKINAPFLPEFDVHSDKLALHNAQKKCFAVGLTSVMDCGLPRSSIELIDELQMSSELKMHVNAMVTGTDGDSLDHYLNHGPLVTDRLNVQSVKFYADGALGSRGARLLEPYSDDPENYGAYIHDDSYLQQQFKRVFEAGFQVCTHAIGDGAVRFVLDQYEAFLKPGNDRRWRIEHVQILHPDDLPRFGQMRVIPSVQSTHGTSDMYWAGERLGTERLKTAYRLKDLLHQNGWLPNGSDFPIEQINPLLGFYAAISRRDVDGWPELGFQSDQALDRNEALKAMTIWAAKANLDDSYRGSLEVGKRADFVVLQEDLMTVAAIEIPKIAVKATYVNGERVH